MTRRWAAWLLAGTLAIAGSQAAHALGYRLATPDGSSRSAILASSGHGYLDQLPLLVALLSVAVVIGLVCSARGAARPPSPIGFALVAPLVFLAQEHAERWWVGPFPWHALAERSVLLGLALQLPFALLAYVAARALLRVTRALLQRERPPAELHPRHPGVRARSSAAILRPALLAAGNGSRGPPPGLR